MQAHQAVRREGAVGLLELRVQVKVAGSKDCQVAIAQRSMSARRGLWVQGRASFPQEGHAGGDDVRGDRVPLQNIDVNEDVTLGQ